MDSVDLKEALTQFFGSFLQEQKNVSPNTLKSYRDAFKLLLEFVRRKQNSSKPIKVTDLNVPLILDFLKNLEDETVGRGNAISTRNYRLAALRSFFQYLGWHYPSLERLSKQIRAIPKKKSPINKLDYLNPDELKILISQVDTSRSDGFRDLALLIYLYNTGARSQEVADTKVSGIDFSNEEVTIKKGKGRKDRVLPLWPTTLKALQVYLKTHRRKPLPPYQDILFINQRGESLTRFGVRRIVQKYAKNARAKCPSLAAKRISTHSFRHTTAMHLLDSGVEMNVIKGWLGHASVESTSRYINADLSRKKKALDKFGPPLYVASSLEQKPSSSTKEILDWLKGL